MKLYLFAIQPFNYYTRIDRGETKFNNDGCYVHGDGSGGDGGDCGVISY